MDDYANGLSYEPSEKKEETSEPHAKGLFDIAFSVMRISRPESTGKPEGYLNPNASCCLRLPDPCRQWSKLVSNKQSYTHNFQDQAKESEPLYHAYSLLSPQRCHNQREKKDYIRTWITAPYGRG